MAQTLETIKGGGGSIKIGTTGTVSALMSREIKSTKSAVKMPSFCTSISVSTGDTTPRGLKPRTSVDEGSSNSSSSTSSFKSHKSFENMRATKYPTGSTHQIPMLVSDDISIDGTPIQQKLIKKGPGVVEIVDIKCGKYDKPWANPITHRLKKLRFSKLSDSIL